MSLAYETTTEQERLEVFGDLLSWEKYEKAKALYPANKREQVVYNKVGYWVAMRTQRNKRVVMCNFFADAGWRNWLDNHSTNPVNC